MNEYDQTDAAFYDSYATGLDGDIQFYVHEAQQAGSPVLELGCGTGRVLLPIAEAGCTIVGLDRVPAMLARAKQKLATLPPATQQRITLVAGDMRDFALGQRFPLVLIPFRAFQHLLTPEDQRHALRCIRDHLTADGRLLCHLFAPRLDIIVAHGGPLGAALKKDAEFLHPVTGHRVVVWETRQYDPEHQRLEQDRIFEEWDREGRVVARTSSPLTLRYVYRYEMQYLLELAGYTVEALYGDFHRGPFCYGGEQIWVAKRT
jgi:SAM-dependent methyltransferase